MDTFADLQAMGDIEDLEEFHKKLTCLALNRDKYPRPDILHEMIVRQHGRVTTYLRSRGIPVLGLDERKHLNEMKSLFAMLEEKGNEQFNVRQNRK